jgi:hypothetical protein
VRAGPSRVFVFVKSVHIYILLCTNNTSHCLQFTMHNMYVTSTRRLGGPQELVYTQKLKKKSVASDGDLIMLVQSVIRHYTED